MHDSRGSEAVSPTRTGDGLTAKNHQEHHQRISPSSITRLAEKKYDPDNKSIFRGSTPKTRVHIIPSLQCSKPSSRIISQEHPIPVTEPRHVHFPSNLPTKTNPGLQIFESARPSPISTSPFDTQYSYKLRGADHRIVWYRSNKPSAAEPPQPRPDDPVCAGQLFLNKQVGSHDLRVWMRTETQWQQIREGYMWSIGGNALYLVLKGGKPRWVTRKTYRTLKFGKPLV
ncbi:hypothetical protein C8R43DRAFT_955260 [Mycena crocata]|nr:hypothetical protein C8R43DRAFT_955260 [Mycena crocata]